MTHWHKFTDKLPEEGQAIATIYYDGSGCGTYRIENGWLTAIDLSTGTTQVIQYYEVKDASAEFSLWSYLPDDFKLWGE